MLESYIKLPNITTSKLQEVIDYLDENNIEYIEEYKRDEEIERLKEEYVILQNASDEVEEEKDREIERLNNIINEIEKESYLGRIENQNNNDYSKGLYTAYKYINDKIKELKGSDKEWLNMIIKEIL